MEKGDSSLAIPAPPRTERKEIEKNRRNHMKTLCSSLSSLLPMPNSKQSSKDGVSLPDQLDEALKYIKSLQIRIEKSKEKKEKLLLNKKRSQRSVGSDEILIEVQKIGPSLNQFLTIGLDDHSVFSQIICVLHKQGAEIVYANFSSTGNSIIHFVHHTIGELKLSTVSVAAVSQRLKELTEENATNREIESRLEEWDFEIIPEMWEFNVSESVHIGV